METIGSILKRGRTNAGVSLREMSALVDIDDAFLSRLENDQVALPGPLVLGRTLVILDAATKKELVAAYVQAQLDLLASAEASTAKKAKTSVSSATKLRRVPKADR